LTHAKSPKKKRGLPPRILLPHGATLVRESGIIELPVGAFLLKIEAAKIPELAEIFDDLATVLATNGKFADGECPTCGSFHEEFIYQPPEEEFGPN
jgi:hypothetical protein